MLKPAYLTRCLAATLLFFLVRAASLQPVAAASLQPQDGAVVVNGQQAAERTLGEDDASSITVTTLTGAPICASFSFSPIPHSPDLFVGKLQTGTKQGTCAGHSTLALFRLDWNTDTMTLLHPLMRVPADISSGVIVNAYDPYVGELNNETWVAFECGGPRINGTSACVAPLVNREDHIDISRLSIPVVGTDSDPKSSWHHSASTPKLLAFNGRFYLYWTALQIENAPLHRRNSIETRGAELEVEPGGFRQIWVKGHVGSSVASYDPSVNVTVMAPIKDDPYQNTTVDTEGLYVLGSNIVVLSSVGGTGPSANAPCFAPLNQSPGCFRLEITRTSNPLREGAFRDETLISPRLPANPAEYPRIVTAPSGKLFLMVNTHPVQTAAAPKSGTALKTGYLLIPLTLQSLQFVATGGI